jgi:site-specific DNA recombinase
MKAILYARYSTELQSSLSIEDQLRVCSAYAERQGWTVAGQHCDAAISGAVRDRPGLNALLAALDRGDAAVIVAESLDRLSRDQEDIAAIFKRVRYRDGAIWTLSEGEISELHVGLRGTMAAMVRKDTADKVKRGLTGRALAGMNPGGMAYGYRKVPKLDERGEPVRGLRTIDEEQAEVIRRIFAWFAEGLSARAICGRLNAEGIPAPSGRAWRMTSIQGDPKRLNGILRNELYRGRLIYNRTRRVYHPVTRRREIRVNPESEWIFVDAPELRIVDEALWLAAQGRIRQFAGGLKARVKRPRRLLSGKAECGVCGATWRVVQGGRWGCAAHHDGRGCTNGRTITTESFEKRVLRGLSERLLDPDLVAAYVAEWQAARAERLVASRKDHSRLERRKADAEARIRRLMESYADGRIDLDMTGELVAQAKEEKARCEAELREVAAEKIVALHPGLAGQYRKRIRDLTDALDGDDATATREAVRALIDRIVVTPKDNAIGTAIEVQGLLASVVELAGGTLPKCTAPLVPLGRIECSSTFLRIAC